MIHAYLAFTERPHPEDQRIKMIEPIVVFFGDEEGVKYWKTQFELAQKQFTKIDWFEKDPKKRLAQVAKALKDPLMFFAIQKFKPAGQSGHERIFYFDGKKS